MRIQTTVVVLLAGLVSADGQVSKSKPLEKLASTTLTAEQVAAVQDGVKRKLRDPESARFGEMVAGRSKRGVISVCGSVNAKSGFGGYTGNSTFSGILGEFGTKRVFLPTSIDSDRQGIALTLTVCAEQGLTLRLP
jgi:hypothetical protein